MHTHDDGHAGEHAEGDAGEHADHDAGAHTDHEADGGHGDNHTTCGLQENCTDTVELAEGLEVEGEGGVFTATILSHNHLSILDNEWVVEITDADGDKVEDATVTVSTFSVDCMHMGPTEDESVMANADGNYEVAPVNGHGGPWDTVLRVEAGDATDTINVHLCIPGASHGGGDGGTAHDMHDTDAG